MKEVRTVSKGIPNKCLVVVADGTRAVFFRQKQQGRDIKLTQDGELTPVNLDNEGPAGVRPPESSDQETDQATFAKQLAHDLNDKALQNIFDDVVLMIDPQTLGQMRPSLHKEVEKRVLNEIAKNVVGQPVDEIEAALKNSLDD